jgi:predicted nucleotidyltransferase
MPTKMKKLYAFTPEHSERLISETRQYLELLAGVDFAFLFGSFVDLGICHDIDLGICLQDEYLGRATERARDRRAVVPPRARAV